MKISIIIPIYNVAKYVVRCLESVSKQTINGKIECVIVDDCGTDNSMELCEEYISNYSGKILYRIIKRDCNGGLSAARNTGLIEATGDYVFFLDSDDEITENAIELMIAEIVKHPGIDVVMGFMTDDRLMDYYNLDCYKSHQYVADAQWIQFNSFRRGKIIPVNGCNKLIRKELIENNKLYFKNGIIHEDDHWMFYLVKYAKTWSFVFEPTYIRYWNENSITSNSSEVKEIRNRLIIMLDHSSNYYEPFYTLQLARDMERYFVRAMFSCRLPESTKIYMNFVKSCIHQHLWKGSFLVILWIMLKGFRNGSKSLKWITDYSKYLYKRETDNWIPIFGCETYRTK